MRSWLGALQDPAAPARGPGSVDETTDRGVSRRAVEALVGMPIRNLDVYEHALRHRSLFRGLTTDGTESNERLEFLGDAVLGAVVAERVYLAFPDRSEGLLTRTRATLVNGKALAGYAESLGLGELVLLSENMSASGGRQNVTILADAFEAIVGAVYLDLGFGAARQFVLGVLDRCVDLKAAAADKSNHKSELLEHVQGLGLDQPTYQVVAQDGPSHDREFTVRRRRGRRDPGDGRRPLQEGRRAGRRAAGHARAPRQGPSLTHWRRPSASAKERRSQRRRAASAEAGCL